MCIVHKGFRGFRAISPASILGGNLIGLKPAIPYDTIHSTLCKSRKNAASYEMKYIDWKNHIYSISERLNEEFKIIKRPALGDDCEYLNSECSIKYKRGLIKIEQMFTKVDYENGGPGKLCVKFDFENRFDFQLSINERDFFDKLFGVRRIKIDDSNFDKRFTIQSNDERIAKKIFKSDDTKDLFKRNRLVILNISSKNRLTKIELKNLSNRIYSIKEYEAYLSHMKLIIDCTLN